MASSSISIEKEMSTAITSSTLTDGARCPVSVNPDFGPGAAMPATSPPTIAPATSIAPTETHHRMAALPSFVRMVTPETRHEKRKHAIVVHIEAIEAHSRTMSALQKSPDFSCLGIGVVPVQGRAASTSPSFPPDDQAIFVQQ